MIHNLIKYFKFSIMTLNHFKGETILSAVGHLFMYRGVSPTKEIQTLVSTAYGLSKSPRRSS